MQPRRTGPVSIPSSALRRLRDDRLAAVADKITNGERLGARAAQACLETHDLAGLGSLALAVRSALYGTRAFYVANLHLNYTNVCGNRCAFCAFHRDAGAPDAYTLTPEEAARTVRESPVPGLCEVHVVGGCHPELPFEYYTALLRALKAQRPGLGLKAFTAVEVQHMADRAGLTVAQCLRELKAAGLSAMPGGGAEIFSLRLHRDLFPSKIDGDRWLSIHGEAHALGIRSNATMLFGPRETVQERARHLLRLRDQQDRTGGFQAFIALPFHPENTPMAHLPGPSGVEILKTIATARLVLDNVPHIKAYWVMLGLKLTQVALSFGADDLEGTIVRERIAHQAGARTAPGLSLEELAHLVREAGFEPVRRDTYHREVAEAEEAA
ncbi:MAG: aminofutalosine synthase MqnE [Deltaproteobacteria bacterium]|nr:MAG: aminofutalosine synthase MqnE [Deltaproteobacteria bacterium]